MQQSNVSDSLDHPRPQALNCVDICKCLRSFLLDIPSDVMAAKAKDLHNFFDCSNTITEPITRYVAHLTDHEEGLVWLGWWIPRLGRGAAIIHNRSRGKFEFLYICANSINKSILLRGYTPSIQRCLTR